MKWKREEEEEETDREIPRDITLIVHFLDVHTCIHQIGGFKLDN